MITSIFSHSHNFQISLPLSHECTIIGSINSNSEHLCYPSWIIAHYISISKICVNDYNTSSCNALLTNDNGSYRARIEQYFLCKTVFLVLVHGQLI